MAAEQNTDSLSVKALKDHTDRTEASPSGNRTSFRPRAASIISESGSVASGGPNVKGDLRKMTTQKMVMTGLRKMSIVAKDVLTKRRMSKPAIQLQYENTYKMHPDDGTKFASYRVEEAVRGELEKHLEDMKYDPTKTARLTKQICDKILDKVKDLNFPRYKFVVHVTMGQNGNQGMVEASRCIWDDKTDNYACITYKNASLFAIACIYGMYFE
ncbi:tctex1 domain-containing protein 2 [Lingula anatina]|uniref:Tctex1 domain-containing protein 2 n=1 Tax=Lingula anatina TaxID=7574 RepID=A0A1S3IZD7_LINAN|nr:tctex1 domain-containing protein 2-like [Lingula anatina]XP_013403351.1 tctex1 domain-containing protein 2 [Lingula anatina]|eukprot:XP_013403350.1 tctex1 domain-containing protein 2-like [Lingula anatina]